MSNIHPIFDRLLSRAEREARIGQRAAVVWFTGLSGSGKSTIASSVERRLFELGYIPQVLDGDNIRSGINSNLGFSLEDRQENIRRIAEVAKLYAASGIVVLSSFISPTREIRALARQIIGPDDFLEIFVDTPLEVCEARDVKGLYAKARRGEISGFTGIDSPYEAPAAPFLHLRTANQTVEQCVEECIEALLPRLRHPDPNAGSIHSTKAKNV
jgi:adenylylsulfate kinase